MDYLEQFEQSLWVPARAEELLSVYGLDEIGWTFEMSMQKRRLGECDYSRRVIRFSEYYLQSPKETIEDVLRHEVAHALVGPNVQGHGYEWKRKAIELGAKPEACQQFGTYKTTARPSYYLYCTTCGKVIANRHRIKVATFDLICRRHRTQVEVYRRLDSENKVERITKEGFLAARP